jgi:arabinoxylan arabinofuranohydrolase
MRFSTLALAALSSVVVLADNPIVQTIYTADPAPYVYNGRLYAFLDHDEDTNNGFFNMRDWRLFSTVDMGNWLDHGVVMSLSTFSWAKSDAWAGQVVARNGKFYYYVPMTRNGGCYAIGVGVSDRIEGPYKDALGKPLLENCQIDPTVYIDDGGQAYLWW